MAAAMNLYDELTWRGMIHDATEGLSDLLEKESVTAYIGFDPTASSLHVGSLLTVMGLARLQRFGHTPIAIVGGGTGMIGDPSGKSHERLLLSRAQIEENVAGIRAQLERFLDVHAPANAARIVNNAVWLDPARTSPFKFYQFWLNTDDRDVIAYLKSFTFFDRPAVEALQAVTKDTPEKREAQRTLAREVTARVHGQDQVARAEHASS